LKSILDWYKNCLYNLKNNQQEPQSPAFLNEKNNPRGIFVRGEQSNSLLLKIESWRRQTRLGILFERLSLSFSPACSARASSRIFCSLFLPSAGKIDVVGRRGVIGTLPPTHLPLSAHKYFAIRIRRNANRPLLRIQAAIDQEQSKKKVRLMLTISLPLCVRSQQTAPTENTMLRPPDDATQVLAPLGPHTGTNLSSSTYLNC
jgi:hypothetical protein